MPSPESKTVILGTGGTIAGTAERPEQSVGYRSAQRTVQALVAAVPALSKLPLEAEQVAQLDSKDIDIGTWQALARRAAHHLARDEVGGVVVTHGTDTLEETAYLLHRVLAPAKPLVLTAAMRPATALQADGPQNLLDAVTLARLPGARGVLVALAGSAWAAHDVRKAHTHRLHAFDGGDAGPVALIDDDGVRRLRDWPAAAALGLARIAPDAARWPWVEILTGHAAARGDAVAALVAAGVRGLVVAGVGNGNVPQPLQAALRQALAAGIAVRIASRCAGGPLPGAHDHPDYGALGAVKSRIELLLELLADA